MEEKELFQVEIGKTEDFSDVYLILAKDINEAIKKAHNKFKEIHGELLEAEIFSIKRLGEVI